MGVKRECKKQISCMPCHYHKIHRAEVVGLSITNYPDIIILGMRVYGYFAIRVTVFQYGRLNG